MSYFDTASAAPLHAVARQALLAALDEGWADPARLYREGRRARLLLDASRESAAQSVGCRPDELVFTPSGTRALHAAVRGAAAGRRRIGRHVVLSAVEHSAVLHAAEPFETTEVAVDRTGRVDAGQFAAALRAETALACLQSANHEVGTLQPVAQAADACRAAGVPLLVDAAQSLAWGPVEGAWSLLAASAHKWGGPPGVGLLVVRKGTRFASQEPADERESGRAPGFENLPAIIAAAASLRAVRAQAAEAAQRLTALVELIRTRVPQLVPDVEVVGHDRLRLPHIVTFSCLYVDGEALLSGLDRAGFSVSSGSSCTSSTLTPSHVLKAMGVLSEGNVRVSLPSDTTREDVERFLDVLPGVVAGVRERLNVSGARAVPGTPNTPASPSTQATPAPTAAADTAGAAAPDGTTDAAAPRATTTPAAADNAPDAEPVQDAALTDPGEELVVDSLGKRCPIPVIELADVIGQVPVGGLVTVLSDDEAARLDIPAWCRMREQEYVGERPAERGTAYVVRRRA